MASSPLALPMPGWPGRVRAPTAPLAATATPGVWTAAIIGTLPSTTKKRQPCHSHPLGVTVWVCIWTRWKASWPFSKLRLIASSANSLSSTTSSMTSPCLFMLASESGATLLCISVARYQRKNWHKCTNTKNMGLFKVVLTVNHNLIYFILHFSVIGINIVLLC